MNRVLWTPDAAADLEGIAHYLETRTPLHTPRIIRTIYRCAESLRQHPRRGVIGRRSGTRELFLPNLPYVVVYRVSTEQVQILRVLHGSMDRS